MHGLPVRPVIKAAQDHDGSRGMHHVTIRTAPKGQVKLALKPAQIGEGIVLAIVEHPPDRTDTDLGQRIAGNNRLQPPHQVQHKKRQANPHWFAHAPSQSESGHLRQVHEPDILPGLSR